MSRLFEGWIEDLSTVSDYSYEFLVDVWNIADHNNRGDWIDNFTSITFDKGWWNLFNFKIGDSVYVKDNDYEIWDGVIDDILEEDQSLLILYETKHDEKFRWVSFEEYVDTLYDVLSMES